MKLSPCSQAVAQRIPRKSLEQAQQQRCSLERFAFDAGGLEAREQAQQERHLLQKIPGQNSLAMYRSAAQAEAKTEKALANFQELDLGGIGQGMNQLGSLVNRTGQAAVGPGIMALSVASGVGLTSLATHSLFPALGSAGVGAFVGAVAGAAVVRYSMQETSSGEALLGTILGGGIGFLQGATFHLLGFSSNTELVACLGVGAMVGGAIGGAVGQSLREAVATPLKSGSPKLGPGVNCSASSLLGGLSDGVNSQRWTRLQGRLEQAQAQKALVKDLLQEVVDHGPLPIELESEMVNAKIAGELLAQGSRLRLEQLRLSEVAGLSRP